MSSLTAMRQTASLPLQWIRPTPADLARWVKKCLEAGSHPNLSLHVSRDRLSQRGISYDDILAILSKGFPYRCDKGSAPGEWKVNLSMTMPNGRDAVAVCLVQKDSQAINILTVMWADRTYLRP